MSRRVSESLQCGPFRTWQVAAAIKQLTPSDAAPLLELASAYLVHTNGDLHPDEVPAPLRSRISARTPPYEALLGSGSGTQ